MVLLDGHPAQMQLGRKCQNCSFYMRSSAVESKSNKLWDKICHKWPGQEMQNLAKPTETLQHSSPLKAEPGSRA